MTVKPGTPLHAAIVEMYSPVATAFPNGHQSVDWKFDRTEGEYDVAGYRFVVERRNHHKNILGQEVSWTYLAVEVDGKMYDVTHHASGMMNRRIEFELR